MADDPKKNDKPEKEAPAAPAPEEGKKSDAPEAKDGKDAKAASAKAPAQANPWIPVLAVIIVLPILSLVVTDMIIIPKIKKAADEIIKIQEAAAHPAEGGVMPGDHGEAKAEKPKEKAKASGGHGEGEAASSSKDTVFENIVANLSGSMKSRFLKISFKLESNDPEFEEVVKENRTQIIDSAIGVISSLTLAELEEPGMKNIVRNDLIDAFNQVLKRPIVNRLFFSEFVIQ